MIVQDDTFYCLHRVEPDVDKDDMLLVLVPDVAVNSWTVSRRGRARDALRLAAATAKPSRLTGLVLLSWPSPTGEMCVMGRGVQRYEGTFNDWLKAAREQMPPLRLHCPGFWQLR